jgi:hypothetical protein
MCPSLSGVFDRTVKSSPSYRRVVRELVGRDLLAGEQSEEVFEGEGGDLRAKTLLGALGS